MKNWYKEIDQKLLPKKVKLKGASKTGISSAPFFLLLSGRSGLGKTNALIELLHRQNGSYDKVILCCMNFAADPLYVSMKRKNSDAFDVYEKQVPSPDDYATEKGNKLIIFDDMVKEKAYEPMINDWFKRGRKMQASMVFITQSYFDVSKLVRRSLSNLYLFPSSDQRELQMIIRTYPFLQGFKNITDRYQQIVKGEGPSDFMNISVQNGTACINFELYRDGDSDSDSEKKTKRKIRR